MFPTLGHLINYLFGTQIVFPMPTYGFVLVMAFLTAGLILKIALKRKEKLGLLSTHKCKVLVSGPINYSDLLTSSLFYFVIVTKFFGVITNYDEFAQGVNDYIFSLKGNYIMGVLIGIGSFIIQYLSAKKKMTPKAVYKEVDTYPHQITMSIVMVAMLSGIIGAKLFDILENFGDFLNDPIAQILSTGGFTFYGGLIVGTFSVWYYIKKKNINGLQMLDCGAPAILAAYAVGRMACMLSGDGCWGIPNTEPQPEWLTFLPSWTWAYDFPHNVINEGVLMSNCDGQYCYMLETPVFPTPLYESALSLLFFLFIWLIQNKIKAAGSLFFIAIGLNGVARFFIEKIRVNNVYQIGEAGITQAEIISTLLVVIGIGGFVLLHRFHKKSV